MESLIRGKSREEKTNNQFEPPVRFNGTYTQVWGAVFVSAEEYWSSWGIVNLYQGRF